MTEAKRWDAVEKQPVWLLPWWCLCLACLHSGPRSGLIQGLENIAIQADSFCTVYICILIFFYTIFGILTSRAFWCIFAIPGYPSINGPSEGVCVCRQGRHRLAIVVNAKVSAGAQTHTWSPGHSRYWSWLGSILAVVLVDIPACHRAAGAEADSTQSTDGLTSVTAQNDRWHHQVPHTLGTPSTNNCTQPFFHGRDPHEKVLQLRKWLHNLNNPVQSEMTPSKENERRRRCSLWFLIWRKVNSSV